MTGRNSPLMHAASALVLNAIKRLAGIPDHLDLISPVVIQSIGSLRKDVLGLASISLNLEEMLIALSISSTTSPVGPTRPAKTTTPEGVTSTGSWYRDLRIVADAARILGKADDAREYAERAEPSGRRQAIERVVTDIIEGAQSQW